MNKITKKRRKEEKTATDRLKDNRRNLEEWGRLEDVGLENGLLDVIISKARSLWDTDHPTLLLHSLVKLAVLRL